MVARRRSVLQKLDRLLTSKALSVGGIEKFANALEERVTELRGELEMRAVEKYLANLAPEAFETLLQDIQHAAESSVPLAEMLPKNDPGGAALRLLLKRP